MIHFHLADLSGLVLVYILVFARTGSMVMLLPGIGGGAGVPPRVRLLLALGISLALTPQLAHLYPVQAPTNMFALGALIVQEVVAGLLVGAMSQIVMSGLTIAGSLIATQLGLSYAQQLDPATGAENAVVGNFLTLLATVLIFETNLHHLAIGAIVGSYTLLPPGAPLPIGDMAELTVRLVSGSFLLGVQLAAPFLILGFAVNAAMGLLARMQPQIQVFFIAAPINIVAGFLLMAMIVSAMMTLFLSYFATQMGHFG
ncbi:MAG: flagellar biosynthetic protein FliR [Rhizomicrobium sp.]|jgi:flagellar biosynthetic protein FliR